MRAVVRDSSCGSYFMEILEDCISIQGARPVSGSPGRRLPLFTAATIVCPAVSAKARLGEQLYQYINRVYHRRMECCSRTDSFMLRPRAGTGL